MSACRVFGQPAKPQAIDDSGGQGARWPATPHTWTMNQVSRPLCGGGRTPDVVRCLFRGWERHRTWIGVLSAGGKDTGPRPVFFCGGGRTPAVGRCLFRVWERHRTGSGVLAAGGKRHRITSSALVLVFGEERAPKHPSLLSSSASPACRLPPRVWVSVCSWPRALRFHACPLVF